ncbi:hypothetical protein [Algicola sagamiensis]|uniref:hypothetical protein n=1 Tax=Algicola sagamiensis TaxID=163869 RepID=UPI0012FBD0C1|nr:hypothetical protein [Algicola sagamiensis]
MKRFKDITGLSYTYSIEDAIFDGDVNRRLLMKVTGLNNSVESSTPAVLEVENPIPNAPGGLGTRLRQDTETHASFTLYWNRVVVPDLEGYKVWAGDSPDFTPSDDTLVYQGDQLETDIVIEKYDDDEKPDTPNVLREKYWCVGAFDCWGDEVGLSGVKRVEQIA